MSVLEKIRQKPDSEKIRLIWIIIIIVFLILVVLWIFVGHTHRDVRGDTSLFQTLFHGAKDAKDNFQLPAR